MLKDGKSLINGIFCSLQIPFRHWCREQDLPYPLQNFNAHCHESPKERGILTIDEIKKIIDLQDESPRAKLATLLGCLCGLRLGEVLGIQPNDFNIEKKCIHICHNWVTNTEGMKKPKCGSVRDVFLPASVEDAFKLCVEVNPYDNSPFVFWNDVDKKRPAARDSVTNSFHKILEKIGIDLKVQKERNLVFHGLRHTFVSLSRASGLADYVVMRMAGHKNMTMTDRYSHAGNIADFSAERIKMDSVFSKVI